MSSNQSDTSEGDSHMNHFGTDAIHVSHDPVQWNYKAIMPPIFMASTFKLEEPGKLIFFLFFLFCLFIINRVVYTHTV